MEHCGPHAFERSARKHGTHGTRLEYSAVQLTPPALQIVAQMMVVLGLALDPALCFGSDLLLLPGVDVSDHEPAANEGEICIEDIAATALIDQIQATLPVLLQHIVARDAIDACLAQQPGANFESAIEPVGRVVGQNRADIDVAIAVAVTGFSSAS